MKWVLFTVSVLFFSGCMGYNSLEKPGGYLVTGFNFNPYVEKGFYFSTNEYNGKYVTMGTLDIFFTPEIKLSSYDEYNNPPKGWIVYVRNETYVKQQIVMTDELLDKMYSEALKLKGNGIMDFKLDWEYNSYYWAYEARFTGTVIKILD